MLWRHFMVTGPHSVGRYTESGVLAPQSSSRRWSRSETMAIDLDSVRLRLDDALLRVSAEEEGELQKDPMIDDDGTSSDGDDGDDTKRGKGVFVAEARRFYILAVVSIFSFSQCLCWFTFSSVNPDKVRGQMCASEHLVLVMFRE